MKLVTCNGNCCNTNICDCPHSCADAYLEEDSPWISVGDRLPGLEHINDKFLLHPHQIVAYYDPISAQWLHHNLCGLDYAVSEKIQKITDYMPLPEPPEPTSQESQR